MMNQMTQYPYGQNPYYGGGMQYAPTFQRPAMVQPLTNEEMNILREKGGGFSTKVTQEDMLKAYCTHKRDGQLVLIPNQDGSFTCPICGETFKDCSLDKAEVEEKVAAVVDILQMIKTCYLDISPEVARQYFPIIPLLDKIPKLAVIASNNFAKYESGTSVVTGSTPYGFNAYNAIMGGGVPAYGGAPMMPMAGQPMQAGYGMVPPQAQMMMPQANGAQPMMPMAGYGQPAPMAQMPMYGQQAPMMQAVTPQQMAVGAQPVNEFGSYAGYMPQAGMPQMYGGYPVAQNQPQTAPAANVAQANNAQAAQAAPQAQPNGVKVEQTAFSV